ncbi:MAG TPA: prolyl oligopeptidase family serine peptidase [Blastocatellia bacterium]|nr:prolyl oligopeptidase family serine peptidase [Blastocatellia bacterium]
MITKAMRRLVVSTFALIILAASAPAQDAGQVLRLSVGYNTLKNSTTLSAEKRAEVDRLGKLAQEASLAKKYGEALKHYYHAITIMRGSEWTPARALSTALTLKLDRAVVEPSHTVRVEVGQIFSLDEKPGDKLVGTFTLNAPNGNAPLKVLKVVQDVEADFKSKPLVTDLVVPEIEDGKYRLTVTFKPADGPASSASGADAAEAATKNSTIHVERGITSEIQNARARLTKTEAKLKSGKQEGLLAALYSAAYRIRLFDLANSGEINPDRINFKTEIKEALSLLDSLDAGKNPFETRRGDFRRAYLSKVDDTLQPYRIFVPSSYDGTKAFPLVIALHGMGGDENSYFDSYQQGTFKVEAGRRGYIVACPKGRQPASMYLGPAEKDVLDVIAEVRRDYKIDADRIYMTGHSMGGYGTWSIAMNHPDLFAALAPVAGGGNPTGMAKIAHIPQFVVHGDDDKTVPVDRSRVMVAAGKERGAEIKYLEIPGGDHITVAHRTFKDVFDWFDAHKRNAAKSKAATTR